MNSSSELTRERLDSVSGKIEQALQRWDNRLVFPLRKLPERYLRGHLSPHIHFLNTNGNGTPRVDFICALIYPEECCKAAGKAEIYGKDGKYQFPMLVDSVQIVDDSQGIPTRSNAVRSAVWLQSGNSCQRGGTADSMYFSAISTHFVYASEIPAMGIVIRGNDADGEFDVGSTSPASGYLRRQLPCEMIKRGPHVMNDFPCENLEPGINNTISGEIRKFFERFAIIIGEDWISAFKFNNGKGA